VSAARWLPAAAVLALALVPWSGNPFYRLVGEGGDGRDPHFDVPLDPAGLRRAGDALTEGRYFIDAGSETPLVQGNLKAAGQLYLARLLPVQVEGSAVVVRYGNGRPVVLVPR
jgi:hypothetical protein